VRMFFFEALVLFSCLYTALIYAIFYSKFRHCRLPCVSKSGH
jgi:hypothetical protein